MKCYNFSVEEVKTRMESMRTMFRKILRKQRDCPSSPNLTNTEKEIARRCHFLKEHLRIVGPLKISLTPSKKKKAVVTSHKKVKKIHYKMA